MKKILFIFINALLTSLFLTACQSNTYVPSSPYTGEPLTIGIIGEAPKVREKNVEFVSLTLNDLPKEKFENLDAVFITKKYLPEAATSQYADIYLNSPVPIVFINSDKVYLAFIDKDLSYEDAHDSKSGDYLIGYYNEQYFGVGLYDHKETKESIEDCYSRVFELIETAKNVKR